MLLHHFVSVWSIYRVNRYPQLIYIWKTVGTIVRCFHFPCQWSWAELKVEVEVEVEVVVAVDLYVKVDVNVKVQVELVLYREEEDVVLFIIQEVLVQVQIKPRSLCCIVEVLHSSNAIQFLFAAYSLWWKIVGYIHHHIQVIVVIEEVEVELKIQLDI